RAEVGVLEEMACHGDPSRVRVSSAGDEAGQGSDERGEFLGGDGQRWGQAQTPGRDGVDDEPGLERAGGHGLRIRDLAVARALSIGSAGRTVARELEPEQQSLARDLPDPVDLGQLGLQPVADLRDVGEHVVLLDGLEHGESGRTGQGVAAEGRAVLTGLEQLVFASPTVMVAPIGMPPPSPFAEVMMSGVTPSPISGSWWANQEPVRPMPDWTSSRTMRAPNFVVSSRTAVR